MLFRLECTFDNVFVFTQCTWYYLFFIADNVKFVFISLTLIVLQLILMCILLWLNKLCCSCVCEIPLSLILSISNSLFNLSL